jgi:hypothetical protein
MPYQLSRFQYGVPATFTFQPNATPHRELTQEQALDYRAQAAIHGEHTDTLRSYSERLTYRFRYYRFFFPPPLYLALPFLLLYQRRRVVAFTIAAIVIFALGTNIYPYFYPHYIAALSCLFLLTSVMALESLSKLPSRFAYAGLLAAVFLIILSVAQFLFWYSLHFIDSRAADGALDLETADYINGGDPEGRIAVNRQLDHSPGNQLVFVRYSPDHGFHEWIHNGASIDSERIVWALDRGDDNRNLIGYFRDRKVWLLEPDASPPRLVAYTPRPSAVFEDVK